jgi:hypothetical protein
VALAHPQELFAMFAAVADRAAALGPVAGVPLVVGGTAALTVAARRRVPLAVVGLAGVGALAAVLLRRPIGLHLGLSLGPAAVALATIGAAVGAVVPPAFPFGAAALVGGAAGSLVSLGGHPAFGALAAAIVAGVLGLALARIVAATAASLAGGLLLAVGLVASFPHRPIVRELAGRPAALVGLALVLGIAGAAFQIAGASPRAGPAARSPGSPPGATPEAGR